MRVIRLYALAALALTLAACGTAVSSTAPVASEATTAATSEATTAATSEATTVTTPEPSATPVPTQRVEAYGLPDSPPEQVDLPVDLLQNPTYRCIAWPGLVTLIPETGQVWFVRGEITGKAPEQLANLPLDGNPKCLVNEPKLDIYNVAVAPNSEGPGVSVSFTIGNGSRYEAPVRVSQVILRDSAFNAYTAATFSGGIGGIILVPGGSYSFTLAVDVPANVTLDTLIVVPDISQPPIFITLPEIHTPPVLVQSKWWQAQSPRRG